MSQIIPFLGAAAIVALLVWGYIAAAKATLGTPTTREQDEVGEFYFDLMKRRK